MLDYSSVLDNPEPGGDILCKPCYSKILPGSLINASDATDLTLIKPCNLYFSGRYYFEYVFLVDDRKGCLRCKGAVFKAEEIVSKGSLFHKKCATCATCQRQLALGSIFSGLGQDQEIYCKICYEKKYSDHRPGPGVSLDTIKAGQGQDSCVRCQGVIFEPERFKTKYFSYHRKCFSCKSCSRTLESTLAEAVHGPDNDVYCSKCYRDKFNNNTTIAYSDPRSIIALDGKGCPRCDGKVFTAEQIVEKGRSFHVGCFTCKKCKKPLKDRVHR